MEYADRLAARANTSRSQVIGQVSVTAELSEQEQVATAGYRFYAGEALAFADATTRMVAEAIATTPIEVTNGET